MNQLLTQYLSKVVCKKCKTSQGKGRSFCINYKKKGCKNSLRARRVKK